MRGRTRHLLAALTGFGLGLSALGPGLASGFVLSYDMVFVPEPGFTRMAFGLTGTLPRHVPSDVFTAVLGVVLPGDLAQKSILLAIFVMACVSAAALVPSERMVPRLAAGVCYAWNPFVAERLLLGQWALLLGYAALPWVVARAARAGGRDGVRWLVLALLPAAIGGFAALAVSGLTAAVVALAAGCERVRALARTCAVVLVLSLPWLVTGWLRPAGVPADGAAVEAFAARADTPFGAVGSLLLLGGVWNGETVPTGYGHPVTATAWLLVVLGALAAYGLWWRASRDRLYAGLAAAALAGFVVASLGVVVPGLLRGLVELWPGFAVLRDGQQYVAPLAVLVAVGLGLAAEWTLPRLPVFVAVCVALVPVALLPSLAWGAAGRLRAVEYPGSWARARQIIAADATRGDVLVLPWAAYRSYPWNGRRRVLDPLPRYLPRRVIFNDAVRVDDTTIPTEDPRARRLGSAIESGGPLTDVLRAEGVRYVAVDAETEAWEAAADPPGSAGAGVRNAGRLAGAELLVHDRDLLLFQIPRPGRAEDAGAPAAAAGVAWIVTIGVVVWSSSAAATTLIPRSIFPPRRRKAP
ncbi:hypothetical protein SAMN04489712_102590 [Thermomonospora echinospora]|uniref:Membrane protein YfhO n=1 Tax=Thermomonospora echinospora TaxID=1992 RepID=A0A1H5W4X5_9ACTN|nr:hypothetical protein [Thermomonospora echinospora]SEF94542.1 hypothetical protein SAMN04489712_102590 [Thermomonospora echinospora]